jgi:hypothetical protein
MSDEVISTNGNGNNTSEFQILLDSTYPLLQKFREHCPGTYKHAQTLSSLIEGVAIALDLDVNFMKVAALYHDVGKMFNPKYFTENQLDDDDPHKNLDPRASYEIISRHVSDSVLLLVQDSNFPRRVIDIISEHHGNSIIKYFFEKSETDNENAFRYKCSNPTEIESAVLMIVDHVEAKSRSFDDFDVVDLVDGTLNELLDSGILDNVTMKLGHLKRIKHALYTELQSTYKKRVSYKEVKDSIKENKSSTEIIPKEK